MGNEFQAMARPIRFLGCITIYAIIAYALGFGWRRFALDRAYLQLGILAEEPVVALQLTGLMVQGAAYALAYPFYAPRRAIFAVAFIFQWSVQAAHVAAEFESTDWLLLLLLETVMLISQVGVASIVVPLFFAPRRATLAALRQQGTTEQQVAGNNKGSKSSADVAPANKGQPQPSHHQRPPPEAPQAAQQGKKADQPKQEKNKKQ